MKFRSIIYPLMVCAVFVPGSAKASTPVPVVTAAGSQAHLSHGVFAATVTGKNFTPSSVVHVCGLPVPTTYVSSTSLKINGFCSQAGSTTLTVTTGSISSTGYIVQVGIDNPKATPEAARRFLEQAAFGPSPSDVLAVQTLGMDGWINAQFAMPRQATYSGVTQAYNGMPEQFMTNTTTMSDQLRQRVAFALSQIWVTSLIQLVNANMIPYQDMLLADAFTNYQQIMTDVTLSPAMGQYLNMANNAKANPATDSLANENYARELMQLFTLGVSQLNSDGSVKVDGEGIPLPTYTQFQVTEFARVFTGWTYQTKPGVSVKWPGNTPVAYYGPMAAYPSEHDTGSKHLLNGVINPAGLSPEADLQAAIKNIFTHPNAGPFVSRLLIQHLVKSNPSPAYIARVAKVFAGNSHGERGDMRSIIKAILLDPEARANDEGTELNATDGHLQEPALFIAGMYRAFGGTINDSANYRWYLSTIGQNLFSSPDVFNYYDWDYQVPGTDLQGGEFDINTPSSAVLRANLVTGLFGAATSYVQNAGAGTKVDLTPYIYLAAYPDKLVDALDLTLTHGTMPAAMKDIIVTAVTGEKAGNLRRVQRGAYLILASNYYNVWH